MVECFLEWKSITNGELIILLTVHCLHLRTSFHFEVKGPIANLTLILRVLGNFKTNDDTDFDMDTLNANATACLSGLGEWTTLSLSSR